jgi:ABC-type lipoprotein export system ATPase subunit
MIHIENCRLDLGRSGDQIVRFELPTLDIAAGEQLALTGPSGCGKSTLLNLLSGLLKPDQGRIIVDDISLRELSPSKLDRFRGKHIGFIYQSFNLLDTFTAVENVSIGMRFGRSVAKPQQKERAGELLERVGLAHRIHARPFRMSVGERQRVAIARALVNRPKILLADEPTGALDPDTAETVFDLIRTMCAEENCTLLFVTHDHALADKLTRQFDCRGLISQQGVEA